MRVIAGSLRGHRLECPSGLALRPTSDRLKESLFNILAPCVEGSRFLDLFSGSGSIGLEAYSRGAGRVVVVEKEASALRCLQGNLKRCRAEEEIFVLAFSVPLALKKLSGQGDRFDIIFLDPPYQEDKLYKETLTGIDCGLLVSPDGMVIAEHPAKKALPDVCGSLHCYRRHRVGDSCLSFYRLGLDPPSTSQ